MTVPFVGSRQGRRLVDRLVGGPVGFRDRLQQLGPTYIKIGQYLALRPDILSEEYCDELIQLFDQVAPFPWEQARAIIREDLGADPSELFAAIDPRPIGAGAIAQIHSARLHDGTLVAVKVRRPLIVERVQRDLWRARQLVRLLELSGVATLISPRELMEQIEHWMLQEVDLRHELANLTLLHRLAVDSPIEDIPVPFPEYSGGRVLTMELVRGVPISELLLMRRSGRVDPIARAEQLGIDRNRLASNLITATLRQVFRYQFFHADLHPGNLFALPDDVIGYVDFGLCEAWDGTMRGRLLRYLSAIYNGDVEQMYLALSGILIPGPNTDMAAFRADFFAVSSHSLSEPRTSLEHSVGAARRGERSPIAEWMIGVMRAVRRHGLQVPARILSIYRALLMAETVAYQLDAAVDLRTAGREFFESLRMDETFRAFEPSNAQPTLLSTLALLRDAPGQVHQLLTELTEGTFSMNVYTLEPPKVVQARNRRTRLVTSAVLTVSLALLLGLPDLPGMLGGPLVTLVTVTLVLLYLSIVVQWIRLR